MHTITVIHGNNITSFFLSPKADILQASANDTFVTGISNASPSPAPCPSRQSLSALPTAAHHYCSRRVNKCSRMSYTCLFSTCPQACLIY